MPELPEVEVLRRSLEPELLGALIEGVEVDCSALREPVATRALVRRAVGREIVSLGRRAKYLLIGLDSGDVVVVHLGMSGRLTIGTAETAREHHEHVRFMLDRGRTLRFRDPRRFGLVLVRSGSRLARDRHFAHLGVEPLQEAFTGPYLHDMAVGRRAPVKSFLMDGRIVVGIGNIYACEALFRAGVHPRRGVNRISMKSWRRLATATRAVLESAIQQGGTTLNDFADGGGNPGYFQVSLAVYDREGQACERCESTVRRIVQSGRSTFYCPGCQR